MNLNNIDRNDNNYYNNVNYNVNNNHPIINNSQNYMLYKKYISIHSEDRDIIRYPRSSDFEIELPEDYLNVASIRLVNWTFPANYNTFSSINNNINFSFKINRPYNPGDYGVSNILLERIFEALYYNQNKHYFITIEEGFYNPNQIVIELTNKFNYAVTQYIATYFKSKSWDDTLIEFLNAGGYTNFIIVFNNVSQKIWFGNNSDGFILTNETSFSVFRKVDEQCTNNDTKRVPDLFNSRGLPANLGLYICNQTALTGSDIELLINNGASTSQYGKISNNEIVPRFYYGDVIPGDNGYWLLPNTNNPGCKCYWIEAPYKINLMGDAYFYMELTGHNCIDETQPFNVSQFTVTTNQTNSIVNSSFAKIAVPTTPISQWFDREAVPYKYYYPPAERIRKLKIYLRYHNGTPVDFGLFNYSFMLEFTLVVPQLLRDGKISPYPILI